MVTLTRNDNKFIERNDAVLNQTGTSEIWINSVDDFPTPVAGVITVQSGIYVLDAQIINPYTLKAAFGASVIIKGTNILNKPYVYVGGGTAFSCDTFVSTLDIRDLLIVDGIGNISTPFNITGASRDNTFFFLYKVIFAGFKNCGFATNIYNIWDLTVFQQFSQGMILSGTRQLERTTFSSPNNVTKNTSCTFDNTTDKVISNNHYMYNNDKIRLKTNGTLPTGLYSGISNINGAVINNGDGTVRLTTTSAHGFLAGYTIFIRNTTNYNGTYIIQNVPSSTTFDIIAIYVSETLVNAQAQLGYFIINKSTNDFQISLTQGGSAVNFTDNGTGDHEFFENSICQTYRGTLYSFNFFQQTYNLSNYDNVTALDFEPTLTAVVAGRGNGLSTLFANNKVGNVFTGSSLTQKYKYFKFFNTLGNPDSKVSGTIYFTGNTTATALVKNTPAPITIASPAQFLGANLERMYINGNKLVCDNPDPITLRIDVLCSLTSGTAVVKESAIYVYKNGSNIILAPVQADVLNRNVPLQNFELVDLKEGDYLEMWIENKSDDTDLIATSGKLSAIGI